MHGVDVHERRAGGAAQQAAQGQQVSVGHQQRRLGAGRQPAARHPHRPLGVRQQLRPAQRQAQPAARHGQPAAGPQSRPAAPQLLGRAAGVGQSSQARHVHKQVRPCCHLQSSHTVSFSRENIDCDSVVDCESFALSRVNVSVVCCSSHTHDLDRFEPKHKFHYLLKVPWTFVKVRFDRLALLAVFDK